MDEQEQATPEELWEAASIAPSDLYYTQFRRAIFGGYDRTDVDMFRDHVADLFEGLLGQVRDLKKGIGEQKSEIGEFHEMEGALRNALKSSQKFSEQILDAAKREADAMLAEACLAKSRAETEAVQLPEALRQEIEELKGERERLRADIQAVLETHAKLLGRIPAAEVTATRPVIDVGQERKTRQAPAEFSFGENAAPEIVLDSSDVSRMDESGEGIETLPETQLDLEEAPWLENAEDARDEEAGEDEASGGEDEEEEV